MPKLMWRRIAVRWLRDREVWIVNDGTFDPPLIRRKADAIRDAIARARAWAESGGSVSLRIYGKNGRIQEERTYPRSSDPRRSKG